MEVTLEKPKSASEEQQSELRKRLLLMILQSEAQRHALARADAVAPGIQ